MLKDIMQKIKLFTQSHGSPDKIADEGNSQISAPAEPVSDEELAERRRKKNQRMGITALVVVLGVTGLLIALPRLSGKADLSIAAEEKIISGVAETGDIETFFSGSGTLSDADAEDITLMDSVELLSFTVKNGEDVKKGDVIAKVNKSTVLAAAAELQDAIDELDAYILDASDDTIASTIWAKADGLVKAIFAESGDSVVDVMYDHGALMLISLDGMLAVDIDANANMRVGDGAIVTLSDGTDIAAKVYHISKGVATVTIPDDSAEYNEPVTVSDESGVKLGEGELYIHSELKLTGFSGTVSYVNAADESYVFSGQTLLTLTDTDYKGDYQKYISLRDEYSQQMERLMNIYSKGYVYAEQDGIISGIADDSDYSPLAGMGASGGIVLLRADENSAGGYVLLSSTPTETDPTDTDPTDTGPTDTGPTDTGPTVSAPPDGTYLGVVSAISYGKIVISYGASPGGTLTNEELAAVDTSGCTESYGFTASVDVSGLAVGDKVIFNHTAGDITGIQFAHAQPGGQGGQSGIGGQGGMSFGAAMGGGESAAVEVPTGPSYTLNQKVVCQIVPVSTMSAVISVDELDVLNIAIGQEAVVTLDAVPGQSFKGKVTGLDPSGSNAGGGTKYSITVTIDRTETMLSGMNASATISLSRVENVLIIPLAAVSENGNKSYVYTGYDEKKDELISPVEVSTGASDGTNVQILGGLEPGEVYYYRYAESLVYSR